MALLIIGLGVLVWGARIAWLIGTAPVRPFTIAPETTWITEPLDELGYPDYTAALNARGREGVPPGRNAAVGYWGAVGATVGDDPDAWRKLFQEIGMKSPEQGDRLRRYVEFLHEQERSGGLASDPDVRARAWDRYPETMKQPWSPQDAPLLAQWVESSQNALDRLVDASCKDRWFSPPLVLRPSTLSHVLLPECEMPEYVSPLIMRAMQRLGKDDVEEAWEDVLAAHRLGRLLQQGPTIVHVGIGVRVEAMAFAAEVALAEHAKLSAQQSKRYQRDLAQLPPPGRIDEKLDLAERFTLLDLATGMARVGPAALEGDKAEPGSFENRIERNVLRARVDWDFFLRTANAYCDRLVRAARIEDRHERAEAIAELLEDVEALDERRESASNRFLRGAGSPRQAAQGLIEHLVPLMLVRPQGTIDAQERMCFAPRLAQIALALNAYRVNQGYYPDDLTALVPQYTESICQDPFTGKSLDYQRCHDGYKIVSPGPNGRIEDLQSTAARSRDESDDLVVSAACRPRE